MGTEAKEIGVPKVRTMPKATGTTVKTAGRTRTFKVQVVAGMAREIRRGAEETVTAMAIGEEMPMGGMPMEVATAVGLEMIKAVPTTKAVAVGVKMTNAVRIGARATKTVEIGVQMIKATQIGPKMTKLVEIGVGTMAKTVVTGVATITVGTHGIEIKTTMRIGVETIKTAVAVARDGAQAQTMAMVMVVGRISDDDVAAVGRDLTRWRDKMASRLLVLQ